jgi:hypothetical protein
LPTYVCQNKHCTGGIGDTPSTSSVYLDFSPYCSDECRAEALGEPTQREVELRASLVAELTAFRLQDDPDRIKADAWARHVAGIAFAALPIGRLTGSKNELPDWPPKPSTDAPAAARKLHLYRSVIRAVVRDFARYELDAERRAECEARKVALVLDDAGLRQAERAAEEEAVSPIHDTTWRLEAEAAQADMWHSLWMPQPRAERRRDGRLTGDLPLYPACR